MSRVVLDAELRAKLQGATRGLEIADEQGNVVGHFVTERGLERVLEKLFPPLSDAEIEEARKEMLEKGGVSTQDILNSMAAAEKEWEALQ